MATKTFTLAFTVSVLSILLIGCVLPKEEAPLITNSRSFTLAQDHSERFRITQNGSTPEYSIRAESVMNKTAIFVITPGNVAVGMTEGDYEPVDLNGDGSPEIVLAMENTTPPDAYITIYIPDASQVCTTKCPIGQKQRPFPDCSCYLPTGACLSTCPTGQVQHPYPDCTCYAENRTCSDGTIYGQCSTSKPSFCNNGTLMYKCSLCGCPAGKSCNYTSEACYTPVVATPTPSSGSTPTPTPSVTPTPAQGELLQAISVANSSVEGQLMSRFDALYKKNSLCTQSEFISTFRTKRGRNPTQNELSLFANTQSHIPYNVSVSATRNGTIFTVTYTNVGLSQADALRVLVSSGTVSSRQWLDGTSTDQNLQLITKAESIPGNCGLIMAINGWA